MILCFAYAARKKEEFHRAFARTLKDRQALQGQLRTINVPGRFNTLGFVIDDRPSNFFQVNAKADETIHQIFVGYDPSSAYDLGNDDAVLKMIGGWIRRVLQETDAYATKRSELLKIVADWEREAVAGRVTTGGT